MHVCRCIYMYEHTYIRTYVCTIYMILHSNYVCACVCGYVHTCVCTYVCVGVYTCMYVYSHLVYLTLSFDSPSLSCMQFIQHLVYPTPGLSNIWFIQHLVYPTSGLSHTWFIQHLVYPTSGLFNIWFIQHLVYPTPGLSNTCLSDASYEEKMWSDKQGSTVYTYICTYT